jgi:hypothetical protein
MEQAPTSDTRSAESGPRRRGRTARDGRDDTLAVGRYPDFLIVGAPRSGTTFMFDYLGAHPRIYASPRKEPHFFATDLDSGSYLDSLSFMRDRDAYLALFDGARSDQLAGEASTWYLYSKAAADNIHAANPDMRIIAMLRDPVHMLYSLHGRRLYGGSEDLADFGEALAAEDDRRQGRRIPPRARNLTALFYREVGRYGEQLERYLDTFGREQVHVVIFDDFIAAPADAYRAVLEFLDVDPDFRPDFKVVNAGAARRSWRLQQLLLAPPVVRVARAAIPPRLRPAVGRTWDRINSRPQPRAPLDPEVAVALRADLLPDIVRLGELIGRDLTTLWR